MSDLPDKTVDPYQRGLKKVWHDPTRYDPLVDGPPYLPKVRLLMHHEASTKQASRSLVASQSPLSSLLAVLRAASFLHQTHHWQTSGPSYYADHLLFERLYNDSQDFIDQVAERTVGSVDEVQVDPVRQAELVHGVIAAVASRSLEATSMVQASLRIENLVLEVVDSVHRLLEGMGKLSNGTDNLLQGVADLHETFVYLLKQRVKPPTTAYTYGR